MGAELGQWHEWDSDGQLDWYLLDQEDNRKTTDFFRELNPFYPEKPALWEIDFDWDGFEWLVADDNHNNVVVFLRKDKSGGRAGVRRQLLPQHLRGLPLRRAAHAVCWQVFNTDDPALAAAVWATTGR